MVPPCVLDVRPGHAVLDGLSNPSPETNPELHPEPKLHPDPEPKPKPKPNQVLDICAAPGSKTGQILEALSPPSTLDYALHLP